MKRSVHRIGENDSVIDAARVMREHDVGFLPVIDGDGVVVGVITDRDILLRAVCEDHSPSKIKIGSIMTGGPVTLTAADDISRAQALMREHQVSRLVIINPDRIPVGVLSISDIAQYIPHAQVGRTIQRIAERKYGSERP